MAVTKTFDTAVPSISAGKVVEWELGSTYVNGVSGTSAYYVTEFSVILGHMSHDPKQTVFISISVFVVSITRFRPPF